MALTVWSRGSSTVERRADVVVETDTIMSLTSQNAGEGLAQRNTRESLAAGVRLEGTGRGIILTDTEVIGTGMSRLDEGTMIATIGGVGVQKGVAVGTDTMGGGDKSHGLGILYEFERLCSSGNCRVHSLYKQFAPQERVQ